MFSQGEWERKKKVVKSFSNKCTMGTSLKTLYLIFEDRCIILYAKDGKVQIRLLDLWWLRKIFSLLHEILKCENAGSPSHNWNIIRSFRLDWQAHESEVSCLYSKGPKSELVMSIFSYDPFGTGTPAGGGGGWRRRRISSRPPFSCHFPLSGDPHFKPFFSLIHSRDPTFENLGITYLWTKPMGGYLVQKTLQGCAANMGSKINLLVYEWPLSIKCKIWYMNGSIFQNLAKFEPKLAQI